MLYITKAEPDSGDIMFVGPGLPSASQCHHTAVRRGSL